MSSNFSNRFFVTSCGLLCAKEKQSYSFLDHVTTKSTDILKKAVNVGLPDERWLAVQCLSEYSFHDDCIVREVNSIFVICYFYPTRQRKLVTNRNKWKNASDGGIQFNLNARSRKFHKSNISNAIQKQLLDTNGNYNWRFSTS